VTGVRSYAQQAEDVRLARAFRGKTDGFYIDVGAAHPVNDSVTKHFYDLGWTGIDIDPNADAAALLRQDRPRNVVLQVGCSDASGEATLYDNEVLGWSTLDAAMAAHVKAVRGTHASARRIPIRTLASICDEHVHGPIDFLKVDVEGHEAAVLQGADFERWRPTVVVVEATTPHTTEPSHEAWEPILTAAHFLFAAFDGINRFYVPAEHSDLRAVLEPPVTVLDDWETHRQLAADEAVQRLEAQVRALEDRLGKLEAELHDEAGRRMQVQQSLDERRRRSLPVPPVVASVARSTTRALQAATRDASRRMRRS